jgi:hypothetical protein
MQNSVCTKGIKTLNHYFTAIEGMDPLRNLLFECYNLKLKNQFVFLNQFKFLFYRKFFSCECKPLFKEKQSQIKELYEFN